MKKVFIGGPSGEAFTYKETLLPIENPDLLDWLDKQDVYPKFYWEDREGKRKIAAAGKILEVFGVPEITGDEGIFFYGVASKSAWEGFPSSYFFLPLYEVRDNYLIIRELKEQNKAQAKQGKEKGKAVSQRKDIPSYKDWELSIQAALEAFDAGLLEKVVLARKVSFKTQNTFSPFDLLKNLKSSASTRFIFALEEGKSFMGATPEMLYSKENNHIRTEALAATAKDEKLLAQEKEMLEFSFVSQFLENALAKICTSLEKSAPSILHTGALYHKILKLKGVLKNSLSDQALIDLLHPTPAIGGYPKEAALDFLSFHEPFERGWYAAPIGFVGSSSSEFFIAIRSCLIEEGRLHLFSGAGIVKGSDAQKEWEELEDKISLFTKVLT